MLTDLPPARSRASVLHQNSQHNHAGSPTNLVDVVPVLLTACRSTCSVAPSSLSGALAALQPAAALRRLVLLDLQHASSLAPLAALTQVTRLELTGHWRLMERGGVVLEEAKRGGGTSSSSSSPLSSLPHLVSLQLRKVKVPAVLPPNLT